MAATATEKHLERFREFLTATGLKFTRQRRAIVSVFYESGQHLSLLELLELAKGREASIGYATVYRTMKLLAEGGFAVEHQFSDGHVRYEPAEEGEHHDHLICVDCGRIIEFEDEEIERIQERLAAAYGMRVTSHRHEIYAQCERVACEFRSRRLDGES